MFNDETKHTESLVGSRICLRAFGRDTSKAEIGDYLEATGVIRTSYSPFLHVVSMKKCYGYIGSSNGRGKYRRLIFVGREKIGQTGGRTRDSLNLARVRCRYATQPVSGGPTIFDVVKIGCLDSLLYESRSKGEISVS
jgi:hypothetical protein